MRNLLLITLFLLFISPGILLARDFSGTYRAEIDGETVILELSQDADGKVTGKMSAEGIDYTVKGQLQRDRISGLMNAFDETLEFSAQFRNNSLLLTLIEREDVQSGYEDVSETLLLRRIEPQAAASQPEIPASEKAVSQEAASKGKVVINGVVLSDKQIAELEQTYKIKTQPGNYWYDSRSGLFGVVGFPAYSFMLAGHSFGKLDRKASNGNTGVFVNGRELPQTEWAVWSQLLGYIIQPGAYWLDENGNAGIEGNPMPTENLYLAAQRNAYRGSSGGGGDNFWSSRFGAGNYDSGNQRGYVSVPGYGPVGYGF